MKRNFHTYYTLFNLFALENIRIALDAGASINHITLLLEAPLRLYWWDTFLVVEYRLQRIILINLSIQCVINYYDIWTYNNSSPTMIFKQKSSIILAQQSNSFYRSSHLYNLFHCSVGDCIMCDSQFHFLILWSWAILLFKTLYKFLKPIEISHRSTSILYEYL